MSNYSNEVVADVLDQLFSTGISEVTLKEKLYKAASKTAADELSERRGNTITSPKAIVKYLENAYLDCTDQEHFGIVFLDTQNQIIDFEKSLLKGTIDSAVIHPRVVAKKCLDVGASAVIVCHNHPAGISEPSRADIEITKALNKVLKIFDIRLVDHIVIGKDNHTSLAKRGEL